MYALLREIDWFDLPGWQAYLAELRADPNIQYRDALIADAEGHIASIRPFFDTPENSPQEAVPALSATETP